MRRIWMLLFLLAMLRPLTAATVSLVDDLEVGTYKVCVDADPNNGLCGWPEGTTVTQSPGLYTHPWGYVIMDEKGQWFQCAYTGDEPVTIAMVLVSFWPNSGCARVLVDGAEVWTGDLDVDTSTQGGWKWVKVAGLTGGHHTIKIENNTTDGRYYKDVCTAKFAFNYLDNDEDGDGVEDDKDACPDSTLAPPYSTMVVDKFGCTPNQNLSELLMEYQALKLSGRNFFGEDSSWNGAMANLCWNFNSWGSDLNITGKDHYLGSIFISRDTEGGISCEHYQLALVDWLVQMKTCKKVIDSSVSSIRTYSDLFNGLDFAPVKAWAPTAALGHKAAAIYFSGFDWKKGMVLDPWVTQKNKFYTASYWANTLFSLGAPDDAERWKGDFPLTGGTGYNYSPSETPGWMDKIGDMIDKFTSGSLLDCQVDLQVVQTATGKRAGLFNNVFVNEIPDAYVIALCPTANEKDKTWSMLLPDGVFDVTIIGKGSDTFDLRVSHQGAGTYSYGTHDISSGKKAVVTIDNDHPTNKMTLPDGSKVTPVLDEAEISLSRDSLRFAATTAGAKTAGQELGISNLKTGVLNWSVADDAGWLSCSPQSGSGAGSVTVSVNPSGLAAGVYNGTITVSSSNASNSPRTVPVTLTVYSTGAAQEPFGEFATPLDNSTVMSSIPVTGWVLDDIGIENVKIYRGEPGNLVFIGDAIFIEGARPDVEQAYPGYPMNYKAGWGYMMLTYFLPNGGNGAFKLHAVATDKEGHKKTLGIKTITCDNAHASNPFGAIDTPEQGGAASGSAFINWGWVLTPQPNKIPINGTTINVYVDGVKLGHPVYNIYRADIAGLFPGYANSGGAAGRFTIDTTSYTNGVHSIQWTAQDSGGKTDGIGSRYFSVKNTGSSRANERATGSAKTTGTRPYPDLSQLTEVPRNNDNPLEIRTGLEEAIITTVTGGDEQGNLIIRTRELERIAIEFPAKSTVLEGFTLVGHELRPLPIGSTLETKSNTFYWHPGVGFLGSYCFVFLEKNAETGICRRNITVIIEPKAGE